MCGVMGVIGKSKNPARSYELSTWILRAIGTRGKDATGFYRVNSDGKIVFSKINIPSSQFVKMKAWKKNAADSIALIGHTRLTTCGTEKKVINNHPHISLAGNLAVVHNGMVFNFKSIAQRNGVTLIGECDSEIILRLIEANQDPVEGIKKVFEEASCGPMACLSVYKNPKSGKSKCYAFRNSSNPICLIDLREQLGQYFFCSTEHIWKEALKDSGLAHKFENVKVVSIPEYEIWEFDAETLGINVIADVPRATSNFGHLFEDEESWYGQRRFYSSSPSLTSSVSTHMSQKRWNYMENSWEDTEGIIENLETEKDTYEKETEEIIRRADIIVDHCLDLKFCAEQDNEKLSREEIREINIVLQEVEKKLKDLMEETIPS